MGSSSRSAPVPAIVRRIEAPVRDVWAVLVDPRKIEVWRSPPGMRCHGHEFDAREGGAFRVSLTYETPSGMGKTTDDTDTYRGHFTRLVPNELVVEVIEFETVDPLLRGQMTVTTMLSDAQGATDVTVACAGIPPGLGVEDNAIGTRMALEKLAALVEDPDRAGR
jgi:uncharacterized protein YndB with AHSA1/START domain